jgi:hypothetical protein
MAGENRSASWWKSEQFEAALGEWRESLEDHPIYLWVLAVALPIYVAYRLTMWVLRRIGAVD